MMIGNMQSQKFGKDWTCSSIDRQADRHAHRNTLLLYQERSNSTVVKSVSSRLSWVVSNICRDGLDTVVKS